MSKEDRLAKEAIQKIQAWFEEGEAGRGGESTPRLAIKFCGGCNPVFERGDLAQKVREGLAHFQWVSWEEEPDLVVIINGCPTACAEWAEVQRRSKASMGILPGGVSAVEKTPRG